MVQNLAHKYSSILQNQVDDQKLSNEGYIVFPLLGEKEINELSAYYYKQDITTPAHFYSSSHAKDTSFRKKSSDFLKKVVSPVLSQYLKEYKILGGAFVVKPADGKGILAPHQDWNIVDEKKFRSYNVWIPLIDVTTENGAVFVQAGSHLKIQTHRGPGIPSIFKNIETLVWENLKPLPMKAGDALIYDHALIHASPNNNTNQIRLGIVLGLIPEKAQMQLYFGNNGEIKAYEADENFFLEKDPNKGPQDLLFLSNVEPNVQALSAKDYQNSFLNASKKNSLNWIKKILWK